MNFLDGRLHAGMPSSKSEDWQPLLLYRNSLLHGDTDQVPVTSKRAYTRRKKEHTGNFAFLLPLIFTTSSFFIVKINYLLFFLEDEEGDDGDDGSDHEFMG